MNSKQLSVNADIVGKRYPTDESLITCNW